MVHDSHAAATTAVGCGCEPKLIYDANGEGVVARAATPFVEYPSKHRQLAGHALSLELR
jgi:hypothetical protein